MSEFLSWSGIFLCVLMLLALIRVVAGPTVIDRIMAANVIGTKTTALLIIVGLVFHRVDMFVDIALAYAMLNFILTIGASRYIKNQHYRTLLIKGWYSKIEEQA
jgi:multicomponent Na+:H+ antiporter subunit F